MIRKVIYSLLAASFVIIITQILGSAALDAGTPQQSDYTGPTGKIELRATAAQDNPAATSIMVSVNSVEIHVPAGWQAMKLSDTTSFDLLKLGGLEQTLATGSLPPGTYARVRLGIQKVTVTLKSGKTVSAAMPGSKFTFVLSFLASAPTAAAPLGNVTVLVFDFNANNCVTVSPQNKATFQAAVRLRSTSTPGSMEIINASLLNGEVGAPYNCQMAAIGGQAPYAWSITMGNLPPGLSLNTATGLISGTPTTAGGYTITARVEDGSPGKKNTTRQLTINVSPAGKLKILIVNMPDGIVGIPYSAAVLVTGGTTPYVFNFSSGTMPDGLKLNSSTGVIDGTLTTQGNYTFSVKVTDAANPANSDIVALTLIVAGAVTVE